MDDNHAYLAAVQLSDSALPIGRFVHSYGLESWLALHTDAGDETLAELAVTFVRDVVAPLDGVVVAHAHRAVTLDELLSLDRLTTAHKLGAPARDASRSCGRRLAALSGELVVAPLVHELAERVRLRETDGNLAVVTGALSAALGLSAVAAVLVELRGGLAGLLSAAVRLGRLSTTRAQALQTRLAPTVATAAEGATQTGLSQLRSTGPDLEIATLTHRRTAGRTFAT